MERDAALNALSSALENGSMPARDQEFAGSLVKQAQSGRGLSEKQWYWVVKLAMRLLGSDAKAVGNYQRVYAMFQHAKAHLKYPKVVLQTAAGREVKLYVSGVRSRVPNAVNVVGTDGVWYGRVMEDGSWTVGAASDESLADVEALLKSFAEDPEGVAAAHGKLVGACCFCNRKLEDERSTEVGYGPVCASKYGLSWGKKK